MNVGYMYRSLMCVFWDLAHIIYIVPNTLMVTFLKR